MVKRRIPLWLQNFMRYLLTITYYLRDSKFLLSFTNRDYKEQQYLRSITEHYHSLEKGLIKNKANFRLGFGKRAIAELIKNMELFMKISKNQSIKLNNIRFQTALSVLYKYIKIHKENSYDVSLLENALQKFPKPSNYRLGGIKIINRQHLTENNSSEFKKLTERRVSVRDFAEEPVDDTKIIEAISLANNTPSVCNRQGWFVRIIKDDNLIKKTISLQGGLRGHGNNVSHLLLITAFKNYFRFPTERFQAYVDGGLYSMSLMYALTSLDIANCPINSNFPKNERSKINKLLDISNDEAPIMLIAVGNYPEVIVTTKSERDNFNEKYKIL